MDKLIREKLFLPALNGQLREIIPDFAVKLDGRAITSSALLSVEDGDFIFELYLPKKRNQIRVPMASGIYSPKDCLTASGWVCGMIAFQSTDIYPPRQSTTRIPGTSTVRLESRRLNLPDGDDRFSKKGTVRRRKATLGSDSDLTAHLIYHGPKLPTQNATSEIRSTNDFLGAVTQSTFDTLQFESEKYKGAFIQNGEELHLHLRARGGSIIKSEDEFFAIVESVNQSAGICFGFQPWPCYREVKIDHVIRERWLRPEFHLKCTSLVPKIRNIRAAFQSDASDLVISLVPCIADGLYRLEAEKRKRLVTLLWIMRSTAIGSFPAAVKFQTACSLLDGMTKLVTGVEMTDKPSTKETWKAASEHLGLSWDGWTKNIFELWGKYRHVLAHGWLWVTEDDHAASYFQNYPKLGGAFLVMVAALCGCSGTMPVGLPPEKVRRYGAV